MAQKNIAVVGGGAKAAALAVKAHALREESIADIAVTIFEQDEIGANWSGRGGYTDGAQRLCTPAERDLGFPYTTILGEPVASYTLKEFSWATFLGSKRPSYRDWVDSGRRPPSHEDFAAYLAWSVKKSGAEVIKAKVGRLAGKQNQWEVRSRAADGTLTTASKTLFDGVVVTGPGPARGISKAGESGRIFNGIDFWKRTGEIRKLLPISPKDGQIAIIGAGGTAAAVLAWLCKNGHRDREIFMIADQGALYTRGDSVFENRLFSDDEAWNSLSPASKREFFDRLNRGVVWGTVMNEVATASRVRFQNGRATRVTAQSTHVEVTIRRGDAIPVFLRPEVLIDAAGFDSWWFLDLLTGVPSAVKKSSLYKDALRDGMNESLEFDGAPWTFPPCMLPCFRASRGQAMEI